MGERVSILSEAIERRLAKAGAHGGPRSVLAAVAHVAPSIASHEAMAELLDQAEVLLSQPKVEQAETVTCDDCAFRYGAEHTNADGTYTCPLCEMERKDAAITELRAWGLLHEHVTHCERCDDGDPGYCPKGRRLRFDADDASTVAAICAAHTDSPSTNQETP